MASVGGYRPGAGRKPGYGIYGEPTYPLRIPKSVLPKIKKALRVYARDKKRDKKAKFKMATYVEYYPNLVAR